VTATATGADVRDEVLAVATRALREIASALAAGTDPATTAAVTHALTDATDQARAAAAAHTAAQLRARLVEGARWVGIGDVLRMLGETVPR
jgi:alkylhydroperoxidase/carboxymuconolactone decarboxylase family protein YurZ